MIDISTYIKRNKMIKESCIIIDNIEDAEKLARSINQKENIYAKFETYSLKNIFMSEAQINSPGINIINCNSNRYKFFENIENSQYDIIFNNIDKCTDDVILEYIKNNKGIYIC